MQTTRENEKYLIRLLDELLSSPGTEWALEDIAAILNKHISMPNVGAYSLIQKIDRHCIETVSYRQATEFYSGINIPSIQQSLVEDFGQMEHERKRDNFQNFSLHMFQQVENLTNYLFNSMRVQNALKDFWDKPAFTAWQVGGRKDRQGKNILSIIRLFERDLKGNLLEWNTPQFSTIEKIRAVLYFCTYNADVSQPLFEERSKLLELLTVTRNQNHRGSVQTNNQQKLIDAINADIPGHYLKFYGVLGEFVGGIKQNTGLLNLQMSNLPYDSSSKKNTSTNRLGAKNESVLNQIRDQLK